MIRTQIQLTPAQSERLRTLARREGVSIAEVIRQSIDRFLEQDSGPATAGSRLVALQVSGRFNSGLGDVSRRHDDYLDEAYRPSAP